MRKFNVYDCLLIVILMILTTMTSGALICSNTDMDEKKGKKVQNEGVSLPLVDTTDSNEPCND